MNESKNKKCKPHRFYHYDDDVGKWAVYEKISPYFKDVDGCVKWSGKNRKKEML